MSEWDELTTWLHSRPGHYGVQVCTPSGEVLYSYHADGVQPAASLIKVPIALTLDHYARLGALHMTETVELTETARTAGDGTVDTAAAGTRWSYATLIEHMLRESDNTASNLLLTLLEQRGLGMAAVNALMQELGAFNTRLQRRFMDFAAAQAGHDNLTTPADMAHLFVHLAVSVQPTTHALLEPLYHTVVQEKIVAGVPYGTRVAHKTGDLPGVEHDVGLVHAPNGSYIIALLGNVIPDPATGQHSLAQASHIIYTVLNTGDHHGA
ncbi:MAG: serine hydrolase [Herpetosiphonaceae bacterium]|nr:serine hydrolase [Herpetosiphonaceae bacterium]